MEDADSEAGLVVGAQGSVASVSWVSGGKTLGLFWALCVPRVVGTGQGPCGHWGWGRLPYLAGTSAVLCGQMEVPGLVHPCPHLVCTV